jgi:hypothetical protein
MLSKKSRRTNPDMLTPEIAVDAEIDFADITPKLIRILKQFAVRTPKYDPNFLDQEHQRYRLWKTYGSGG